MKKNKEAKSSLLDRRNFLKASTAVLSLAVSGKVVSELTETPPAEENNKQKTDPAKPKAHFKAGWMAF
jgi:hypothetical protein